MINGSLNELQELILFILFVISVGEMGPKIIQGLVCVALA